MKLFGVSNFPAGLLREALEHAPVSPTRSSTTRSSSQPELSALAREQDMIVERLLPARARQGPGRPDAARDRRRARQDAPGRSRCAGCWTGPGRATVPNASSHERRGQNFEVFGFELSDEERAQIDELPKDRRQVDPGFAPDWDD